MNHNFDETVSYATEVPVLSEHDKVSYAFEVVRLGQGSFTDQEIYKAAEKRILAALV